MEMELKKPFILVINIGSSSQKCALFAGDANEAIWQAHLTWNELKKNGNLKIQTKDARTFQNLVPMQSLDEGLSALLEHLWTGPCACIKSPNVIDRIGHRVVHGGSIFRTITQITPGVKEQIRSLIRLAPLHNSANLRGIEIAKKLFIKAEQFAIFDTAFHQTLPEVATLYPGPFAWQEKGICRYGFHGINYQYCSRRLERWTDARAKVVICHLGSGASLCALQNGKSVETTMGFTPLEGLMMATRSGSIDPSILIYLMRHEKKGADELEEILNNASGFLGLCGHKDMRTIIQRAEANDTKCQTAISVYIHRLCGFLGAMIASLGGLDMLVFTGGVGENSILVRDRVCAAFSFLGLELNQKQNQSLNGQEGKISDATSKVAVYIIPAKEEEEIARQCLTLSHERL